MHDPGSSCKMHDAQQAECRTELRGVLKVRSLRSVLDLAFGARRPPTGQLQKPSLRHHHVMCGLLGPFTFPHDESLLFILLRVIED